MRRQVAISLGVAGGLAVLWLLAPDHSLTRLAANGYTFLVDRLLLSNRRWPLLTKAWIALILILCGLWLEKLLQVRMQHQGGAGSGSSLLSNGSQLAVVVTLATTAAYSGLLVFRDGETWTPARTAVVTYADNAAYATSQRGTYFALTPAGVRYSERGGVDPQYGVRREPVTPAIAANLQRSSSEGREPRRIPPSLLDTVTYFDPETGDARVWYAQNPRRELEAFDAPGRHPAYGTLLRPVTPPVVEQLVAQAQALKPRSGGGIGRARAADQLPAEGGLPTGNILVLAYAGSGGVDAAATAALADALNADGGALRYALDAASFTSALAGDARPLARSSAATARLVVLARVASSESVTDSGRAVTVIVQVRAFQPHAKFESKSFAVTATRSSRTAIDPASEAMTDAMRSLVDRLDRLGFSPSTGFVPSYAAR